MKKSDNEADMVLTITMNSYQVVTEDGTIPTILSSDSHRGGGIAIVIPKSNRELDGKRIRQIRNSRSNE